MTTRSDNARANPFFYYAYLIRLWRDTSGADWRASAQSVHSGEIVRFGSLQALFEFLEEQTVDSSQVNTQQNHDLQ